MNLLPKFFVIEILRRRLKQSEDECARLRAENALLQQRSAGLAKGNCNCEDIPFKPCAVCFAPVCWQCEKKPEVWYSNESYIYTPASQTCVKCNRLVCSDCTRFCQSCHYEHGADVYCTTCWDMAREKLPGCGCLRYTCGKHKKPIHGRWCSTPIPTPETSEEDESAPNE